jgi:hypothetical protein
MCGSVSLYCSILYENVAAGLRTIQSLPRNSSHGLHIRGRILGPHLRTPNPVFNRGFTPRICYTKGGGVNPGFNPRYGVLRFGLCIIPLGFLSLWVGGRGGDLAPEIHQSTPSIWIERRRSGTQPWVDLVWRCYCALLPIKLKLADPYFKEIVLWRRLLAGSCK